ncbi:hypothetical protein GALMADRAFT_254153 [Galerina marginata CBS 339.88]|uniref:Uncharacterized protein n=1 Tax=Galerina marginata (strain CBS 339.88) TaxID=685588 RepID=A0A067SX87_GALM3|nr:hypothetical protein GALMADRAFT_254153 [Galerina marginata CBS 339.88]
MFVFPSLLRQCRLALVLSVAVLFVLRRWILHIVWLASEKADASTTTVLGASTWLTESMSSSTSNKSDPAVFPGLGPHIFHVGLETK